VLAPRPLDPLEELVVGEAPVELVRADEPVLAPVLLAGAAGARRRRDGELQLRNALEQQPRKRALALAGRAGDDEDRRPSRFSG
jgi:hypothetical protein